MRQLLFCAHSVALACALTATSSIQAAETLDQQNNVDSSIGDTASKFSQEVGQTFTVGLNGTLIRIEVLLARLSITTDDAILTVYNTSAGLPNANLGSATVNSSLISTTAPTLISFNVSAAAIPVHANDVLAYGITSSTGGLYITPNTIMNTYAGGSAVRRTLSTPPGPWSTLDRDGGFKTYVDVVAGLLGDFNGDHIVNAADYTVWRDHFGAPTEASLAGNGDGMNGVDTGDYALWKSHFGTTGGAGSGALAQAAAPEPALFPLLIIASAFFPRLRPRPSRR